MRIAGYLRTSLIEWPGKISSVIFVPGCNFRCPFCHNSDLVDPKKMTKQPTLSEKKVLADLEERKRWVDGVAITGGEPTLQTDLDKFLKGCRQKGFKVMVETNGSVTAALRSIIDKKLVDYLAMDLKAPLDKRYAKAAGLKNFDPEIIKRSIEILLRSKIPFELRTTIVPGIHDKKTLVGMAKQLKRAVGKRKIKWVWQNFQPKNCLEPKFKKVKPYNETELEGFLKTARKYIPEVELRSS